jgi:BolA protein
MGIIEAVIVQKLTQAFAPNHLEVINESSGHNVPAGSESHFKVIISADFFREKSAVKRHQAIYAELAEELKISIHALSLFAYSTEEWVSVKSIPQSPKCMGGSKPS